MNSTLGPGIATSTTPASRKARRCSAEGTGRTVAPSCAGSRGFRPGTFLRTPGPRTPAQALSPSTALIVRALSAPISAQYRPDDQLDPARADRAGAIRAGHGDFRPARSNSADRAGVTAPLRGAIRACSVRRNRTGPAPALHRPVTSRRRPAPPPRGRAGSRGGSRRGRCRDRRRGVPQRRGHRHELAARARQLVARLAAHQHHRVAGAGGRHPAAASSSASSWVIRSASAASRSPSSVEVVRSSGTSRRVLELQELHRPLDVGEPTVTELGVGGRVRATGQPLGVDPGLDPADLGDRRPRPSPSFG